MTSLRRMDTVLPVVDMKRARRFYHDTLGLDEVDVPEEAFSEENAYFQAGDCTRVLLYKRSERTKAEHTEAMFTVDDLDKAVDDLTARGVRFEQYDLPGIKTDRRGIARQDGMRGAWFKDTEGNILGIGELY